MNLDDLFAKGCYIGVIGSIIYNPSEAKDADAGLIIPIGLDKKVLEFLRFGENRRKLLVELLDMHHKSILPLDELGPYYEDIPFLQFESAPYSHKWLFYDSIVAYGKLYGRHPSWLEQAYENYFGAGIKTKLLEEKTLIRSGIKRANKP